MVYIDPANARYGKVSDAADLSVVFPLDEYNETFLATGGADGDACFLSGDHAGHCMKQANAINFRGVVLGGLTLEVDPASAYNPHDAGKRRLSVVRQGSCVGLFCTSKQQHGFPQTVIMAISGTLDGEANERVAFTRWRLVLGSGLEAKVILEFDSETVETSAEK